MGQRWRSPLGYFLPDMVDALGKRGAIEGVRATCAKGGHRFCGEVGVDALEEALIINVQSRVVAGFADAYEWLAKVFLFSD